jgi:Lar family restriction alleviation protein
MSEKPMPCDTRIEKFPPLYEVMPCPFCGADREYIVAEEYEHGAGKRWRVFCLSCMATMDKGYCQTQWQALEAWNRRAERTGRWIDEGDGYWKCSACSDEMVADAYGDIHPIADCGWIYCPYCGAKMDGEKEGV